MVSSNSRSRTPIVIAAVIVVVAVAALVAVLLTRNSDDDADDADAGASPTTQVAAVASDALVYGTVTTTGDPLPEFAGTDGDAAVGMAAPALSGTTYAGEPIAVTPGTDGPTMLVFLAHWCPHCNAEIPVLNEWRDAGGLPDGVEVVGVSTAATDQRPNFPPAQWLADKQWTWPAMADDEALTAFRAYGGTGFPSIVVIGADGTVKARASGELPPERLDELAAIAQT
jgi:thiol-disulfide isomerase/thioredoxin